MKCQKPISFNTDRNLSGTIMVLKGFEFTQDMEDAVHGSNV